MRSESLCAVILILVAGCATPANPEQDVEMQQARAAELQRVRALLRDASAQKKTGNPEAARATVRAAWKATKTLPDAESRTDVHDLRSEIGTASSEAGDLETARLAWESVHEFRARTLPDEHPDLLRARTRLAMTKRALGDLEGALPLFEQVLEVLTRVLPDDHPDLQMARANVAATKSELGRREGAMALDGQVFEVGSRTLPDGHPEGPHAGGVSPPQELLNAVVRGMDARLTFVAANLSPRAHEDAYLRVSEFQSRMLSAPGPGAGSRSADELAMVLRFRGRVERATRRRGALERVAERDELLSNLILAARQADLDFRRALAGTDPGTRGRVQALRYAWESSEEAVARAAAKLPQPAASGPHDLSELARHLPEDAAVVVTASYARSGPVAAAVERRPEPTRSVAAFVLGRDASVQRVDLGGSERIAKLCSECVRSVAARVRTNAPPAGNAPAAPAGDPASELAEVLAPLLAALPASTKTVFVAPEEELASIPWEVLPSEGRPLGEKLSVRYVDTLDALVPRAMVEGERSLLVFGGIDYAGEPVAVASRRSAPFLSTVRSGGRFAPLPGSRREADTIRAVFAENFPANPLALLTERAASKAAFLALAEEFRVVHLATHAFVAEETDSEPGRPEDRSGAPRGAGVDTRTDPQQPVVTGYGRGLLSGIVFAGANRDVMAGQDDSVLTAAELSLLDLSRCELAVLSACWTNVGPRYLGESVTGLNRALQLAGVRHTITSLWKVDDDGAAAFFRAFYEGLWKKKLSMPAAFEAARDAVIRAGFGPGVWAGFVLYVS